MKIIQIITLGHEFYGAQSHILELSDALQQQGHDVLVLVGSVGDLTDKFTERNLTFRHVPELVHPMKPLTDLKAVKSLSRIIKDYQPDIVATHSSKAGIVGRLAAKLSGVPSTFTAHGWSFADGVPEKQRRVALILERFTARFADKIIAVADNEREFGLLHKVAPPEKVVTIHYGVEDHATLHPVIADRAKSEKRILNNAGVQLTMVAGFRKQKDHPTLINALAELSELNWHLNLLGDGELQESIAGLIDSKNLSDRVSFHGAVNNVTDYLLDTDLLVLTTNWEGLPISTIEGLSFGLPVIATSVAGTREQVIDNYNGITVPRGDASAVKQALEMLIPNPALRVEYGTHSRQLFVDKFLLSTMVDKTLAVYRDVLENRKK